MADDMPLVSIVTVTYNQRPWIRACVESVIAQTEPRWEQIVVDDGSTDGTNEVIRRLAEPRVRYLRRPHGGIGRLGDAYNLALAAARADLVAILEGDDFWPPDKLELQLPSLADPATVLSWGRAGEADTAGRVVGTIPSPRAIARARRAATRRETLRGLLRHNDIPACTVICRRSALLAVGGFRQPSGLPNVDYPTWLELSRLGRFEAVPRVLGYWRRHDGQVSARLADALLRNGTWGRHFVEALPEAERARLRVSSEEARRIERANLAALAVTAGRAAAASGRRRLAAAQFRTAFRGGTAATRARAVAGLAGLARLDPAGLADRCRRRRTGRGASR